MKNIIKKWFENKKPSGKSINRFLRQHKDIEKWLKTQISQEPQYEKISYYIITIINNVDLNSCIVCGKTLTYTQHIRKKKYCCRKCAYSSKERLEKTKKTNLERYGVECPSQLEKIKEKTRLTNLERYGTNTPVENKKIKEKIKQTNLDKYGVEYTFQSVEIKEKIKQTNLDRYGVERPSQLGRVKEKNKQTNLDRYGVRYVQQNKKVKEKSKQTNLDKYGVENPFQSVEIKEKIKQTNLDKYGFTNVIKSKKIKEKIKQTNLDKYGVENPFQLDKVKQQHLSVTYDKFKRWKKMVVPLFTKEEYLGYKKEYKWKCVRCNNKFIQQIYHTSHLSDSLTPRCLNCYPYLAGKSLLEKEIVDFLKPYFPNLIENNRKLIAPYELDIIIPSKKIAIEFDGLYWHNDNYKNNNYHLMKTQKCEKQNYQLIHIFEDEWLKKQKIVKSRLKAILGLNGEKVYARKCVIKELDSKTKNIFLEKHHLQGPDRSKVKLGLYYQEELVSVMTFGKPRFNKNYEWELIRFASKLQVVGGASKLLKYFERNYNPKNIISYADRRYSKGNVYKKLGFNFLRNSEPNYFWIKEFNKLPRYKCQKHKLKKLLGVENFDTNLSENENMSFNGFNKIYDCGNIVFIKNSERIKTCV